MKLINIGFGSMIAAGRLLAIVAPDSAPIKRVIQEARDRGMLIDASYGRKTKAVILMDTDHVILSAIPTETIYARWMDMPEAEMITLGVVSRFSALDSSLVSVMRRLVKLNMWVPSCTSSKASSSR